MRQQDEEKWWVICFWCSFITIVVVGFLLYIAEVAAPARGIL